MKFHGIQIDQNPFPINTLELTNPKVLIRPDQAEKAKGKNVIIGEERPEKKVPPKKTPQVAAKTLTLEGQDKNKNTGSTPADLIGSQAGLTDASSKLGDRHLLFFLRLYVV